VAADHDPMGTRFYRGYRGIIVGALKHRLLTGALVIAAFMGGMTLMGQVPALFFPPDNQPFLVVKMTLPIGTPIEKIDEVAKSVEGYLQDELGAARTAEMVWNPETRVWQHKYTYVGEGVTTSATFVGGGTPKFVLGFSPDPPTPNSAVILANATSDVITTEMMPKIERFAQDRFPDLRIVAERLQSGPPVADPVAVRVSGQDQAALFRIVEQVKKRFAETPGTRDITDNWGRFSKKLLINIDAARTQRVGASNQDVAVSLQTGLSGVSQTSFREGDKSIPITLRAASAERQDIGKLETLNIYASQTGQPIPLKQIAEPELVWEPAVILRRDGALSVNISSQLAPGANAAVVAKELGALIAEDHKGWPTGYRYEVGGAADASNEANKSIGDKMPLALAIIIMLLIGTFNSLRRAAIVLLTIPLAMIGVSIGLYTMGSYFGFMTLLGIISLAGIVINNAIVLLDRIRIEIEDNGLEPSHAILQAAQLRLRPILLTTATTVGGLIPLWLGGGVMWEPMAISIIFGLLFATLLTLGVVPLLYSVFYRVSYKGFDVNAYYPPAETAPTTEAAPA
ncbi:MAG: multidrug efflux pump, partial [Myxococcota bacterium]